MYRNDEPPSEVFDDLLHSRADIAAYLADEGLPPIDDGINWSWATFPDLTAAERFHALLGPEWETRGVYPATANGGPGVRFRLA